MYLEKITENILTNHTMDDEDPMYLNIRSVQEFVDIQTDAIIFDDKEYTYLPVIKDTYVEQFRIKKICRLTRNNINLLLSISLNYKKIFIM